MKTQNSGSQTIKQTTLEQQKRILIQKYTQSSEMYDYAFRICSHYLAGDPFARIPVGFVISLWLCRGIKESLQFIYMVVCYVFSSWPFCMDLLLDLKANQAQLHHSYLGKLWFF